MANKWVAVTHAKAASLIGEGIHTGARHMGDSEVWRAISESDEWHNSLDYFIDSLGYMGYALCKREEMSDQDIYDVAEAIYNLKPRVMHLWFDRENKDTGFLPEPVTINFQELSVDIQEFYIRQATRVIRSMSATCDGGSFEALAKDIAEWQDETFPDGTLGSAASHLEEEASELLGEVLEPTKNMDAIAEEAADVLFLLIAVSRKANIDLLDAAQKKLIKNKSRQWEKAEHGYSKHVEDSNE